MGQVTNGQTSDWGKGRVQKRLYKKGRERGNTSSPGSHGITAGWGARESSRKKYQTSEPRRDDFVLGQGQRLGLKPTNDTKTPNQK